MTPWLRFTVGSTADRDDLVADLIADDVIWAQINQESGDLEIEVYSNPSGDLWMFRVDELMAVLAAAKERLIQLRRPK